MKYIDNYNIDEYIMYRQQTVITLIHQLHPWYDR